MLAIETLPLLLAGPILRRTDKNQVYIWFITSKYVQPEAIFFQVETDTPNKTVSYNPLQTLSYSNLVRAGKHLYTYLLKVTPAASQFPVDSLIAYNLRFKTRYEQFDLGDLNLLDQNNPKRITYGELQYPTFLIQEKSPANILYGSCQKPHGEDESVIGSADDRINQHALDINDRPSSLFLMGDQIYADDVADPLLFKIQQLGPEIISESLNQIKYIDPRLDMAPFNISIDKINGRQFIMKNFAKFTSHHASNHLIRFQEYAMMYLLVLGPSIWDADGEQFPTFQKLIEMDKYYFIFPTWKKRKRKKEMKNLKKQYEKQIKALGDFIPTLSATRRVLANTPTYMIFDDHDITDDWNISQDWIDQVYQSSLGSHIITNGLSAYWLFQAWGNNPDMMKPTLRKFSSQFNYYIKYSSFPDSWANFLPQISNWCFMTPTNPGALFLDIRTMREFDYYPKPLKVGTVFQEGRPAPQLIGKNGWNVVHRTLTNSNWSKGDPLIIISPTPVYGLGIIESFLKRFVYPLRAIGLPVRYALDFEAWKYNAKGFNQLIQHLLKWNPEPCIILSGDVHYANAVRSKLYIQRRKRLTIHQFTSSPIHNMSFYGIWGAILKGIVALNSITRKRKTYIRTYDKNNNLSIGKFSDENSKLLVWHEEINYLSPLSGKVMHTQNNIGLLKIAKEFIQNQLWKKSTKITYTKTDIGRKSERKAKERSKK